MLINSYDLFVTACIWERRTFFPEREARDRDNHRGCDKWQEAFFTRYAICHFLIPRVFSPIPLLSEHSPPPTGTFTLSPQTLLFVFLFPRKVVKCCSNQSYLPSAEDQTSAEHCHRPVTWSVSGLFSDKSLVCWGLCQASCVKKSLGWSILIQGSLLKFE